VDKIKYAEKIAVAVKAYNEATAKFDSLLRKTVGDEVADQVAKLVDLANPSVSAWDKLTIPTSGWAPFMFHDRSPKHRVTEGVGAAKRTAIDLGFKSAVDLDFGGAVPNNWTEYNASAKIITPFRYSNSLWGTAQARGIMTVTS